MGLNITQEEDGSGRTAGATVTAPDHRFLSVSHLVQMDTGVDGSFGLVALQVRLHSLFTHANSGKHLSDILKHKDGDNRGLFFTDSLMYETYFWSNLTHR